MKKIGLILLIMMAILLSKPVAATNAEEAAGAFSESDAIHSIWASSTGRGVGIFEPQPIDTRDIHVAAEITGLEINPSEDRIL